MSKLAKTVRAYIDSDDQDRIAEFDAMEKALVAEEGAPPGEEKLRAMEEVADWLDSGAGEKEQHWNGVYAKSLRRKVQDARRAELLRSRTPEELAALSKPGDRLRTEASIKRGSAAKLQASSWPGKNVGATNHEASVLTKEAEKLEKEARLLDRAAESQSIVQLAVKTVEDMGHRGYTSAKTFKEAAVHRLKNLIPEPAAAEPPAPEGRPEGCDCWGSGTCSLCDPDDTGRRTVGAPATVEDLRALGWTVAVHNDYRLQGQPHTFWLFTKGDFAAKGEGQTDSEALSKAMSEARRIEARWA